MSIGTLNAIAVFYEDERAPAPNSSISFSPGRFHLRSGRISRRGEDTLRPDDLRGCAHPRRNKSRKIHIANDGRRLPAVYKGYLADPISRTLAALAFVAIGTTRILVARLAEIQQPR